VYPDDRHRYSRPDNSNKDESLGGFLPVMFQGLGAIFGACVLGEMGQGRGNCTKMTCIEMMKRQKAGLQRCPFPISCAARKLDLKVSLLVLALLSK
jgi:hypothetical protein